MKRLNPFLKKTEEYFHRLERSFFDPVTAGIFMYLGVITGYQIAVTLPDIPFSIIKALFVFSLTLYVAFDLIMIILIEYFCTPLFGKLMSFVLGEKRNDN